MTFYLRSEESGKFKRVSKEAAMNYMDIVHGKGSFEERIKATERFHSDKFDIIYSWEDFRIKKFCKEK